MKIMVNGQSSIKEVDYINFISYDAVWEIRDIPPGSDSRDFIKLTMFLPKNRSDRRWYLIHVSYIDIAI